MQFAEFDYITATVISKKGKYIHNTKAAATNVRKKTFEYCRREKRRKIAIFLMYSTYLLELFPTAIVHDERDIKL